MTVQDDRNLWMVGKTLHCPAHICLIHVFLTIISNFYQNKNHTSSEMFLMWNSLDCGRKQEYSGRNSTQTQVSGGRQNVMVLKSRLTLGIP